jgi:hypothetical protein
VPVGGGCTFNKLNFIWKKAGYILVFVNNQHGGQGNPAKNPANIALIDPIVTTSGLVTDRYVMQGEMKIYVTETT